VEHYTPIPNNASKNMLLGYHYALRQQSKLLAKERIEIQKRRDSDIAASDAYHKAHSDASYMNNRRHRRHASYMNNRRDSDYLQAVKLLGGTREIAMQSLQLHLTGIARSWLSKLGKETIGSWEELTKQFTSNFKSTYKQPASIKEVKACVPQRGETLRAYIQRWSIIKNSAVEVSDERAIDAFIVGLRRGDLVEEMGRIKLKIVSDSIDIANRFVDGEDACNNKWTRSPKDDRGTRYGCQRRRSRNYDNYGSHSQVAPGYKVNSYQGNDCKSLGYHSYGKEDYKKFQTRESREYNPSPEDMLNGPCHIHSMFVDGK
jgi:hypothetical protein